MITVDVKVPLALPMSSTMRFQCAADSPSIYMSLHGAFWPFQPLWERLRTDSYSTTNPTVLAILHFSHVQLAFYCFSLPRCFLFDLHCMTRGKGEPQASASQTLGGSSLLPVFTGPLQHLLKALCSCSLNVVHSAV